MGNVLFDVGTTPYLELSFAEGAIDLNLCANIYVTIEQNNTSVRKDGPSIDIINDHTIGVQYYQEDTLQFRAGEAILKVNMTYAGGLRNDSKGQTIITIGYNTDRVILT